MNKKELAAKVAEQAGLTQKATSAIIDAITEAIMNALKQGNKVRIAGFGRFEAKHRAARKGTNPATGSVMDIPARTAPSFTAGKAFKDALN